MKNRSLILLFVQMFLMNNFVFSQNSNAINFQAIAKSGDGNVISNQDIRVLVQLIQLNLSPETRYSETHLVSTNNTGFFVLEIGNGSVQSGAFENVEWEHRNVKLTLKVDESGGTNFVTLGTTQLLTVPYSYFSDAAKALKSDESIVIQSEENLQLVYGGELIIGDNTEPDFYSNENGKIGIGTKDLDEDDRKDIEIGVNKRIWGYSNQWHLDHSGVFNLQAIDSNSKPAIVWYSPEKNRQAAIVAHLRSGGNSNLHNHWSIETSDEAGELHTRMEFPLNSDWSTIETHSSNFKVGDEGDLMTTGRIHAYGAKKAAFGDKDWANVGVYGDAKWEFYRSTVNAQFLIHQGDGNKKAELILKNGTNEWNISNRDYLDIRFNNNSVLTLFTNRNVGIGITEPTSKLHVDGDVKITAGHSYLTAGGDYAEYFQSEGELIIGDVVGINLSNGLARKYQEGDALLGIISNDAGFIGNDKGVSDSKSSRALVGLVGQLKVNEEQVLIEGGFAYTSDMKKIGIMLASGKVFIRMN